MIWRYISLYSEIIHKLSNTLHAAVILFSPKEGSRCFASTAYSAEGILCYEAGFSSDYTYIYRFYKEDRCMIPFNITRNNSLEKSEYNESNE